jgi:CheY-like chemotaxis protein
MMARSRRAAEFVDNATRLAQGTVMTEHESRPSRRPIVLVVDDDELVLEVTAALLVDEGFRVITADGPRQAIESLSRGTLVDAILCDVDLQDSMDGFALKGWARANRRDVPVLLTTAFPTGPSDPFASQDEILAKPYSIDSVVTRLRKAITDGA